ncbi:ankyrin repeat, SAM and basic leucine zipper domain-containing protein 1-like [Littorina saxatilis]|uniref:SAM domain-containing protein n=1 Tax=Littorina saxatilis TaxID=31220 RepID=A0AAN9GA78_9CAEN
MAASGKPAGFEDSDDEDGFMFGDEDYSAYSSENGGAGFPAPNHSANQSRVSFGAANRGWSSGAEHEDFRMAVKQGNLQAVEDALNHGVDVNTQFSSGWSALMYAGNSAKGDIFKLLLGRGANPNFHDKDLYTVLMATCGCTNQEGEVLVECVKLLIEKGADVNAHDRQHVTPLMYAAKEGRLEIVQLLLDSGAEIDRQDSRGWTAVSWATQRLQLGVVKLLLDSGADRNKRHSDNLTAIDLARGKEEVLWLFEGRHDASSERGAGDAGAAVKTLSEQGMADLKYGDLEVFLFGLDLGQFHSVFQAQQVDFALLLTLNEDDLINMGITQVGVRKKLLEGMAAVHKRNWESSSLVPIRIKSQVQCADAMAIVANLSKHLRYLASSVTYIKDHVKRDPHFLTTAQNGVGPKQLLLHTGDGRKNATTLQQQLTQLHSLLSKELASSHFSPPDQITGVTTRRRRLRYRRLAFFAIGASGLALLVWKRDCIAQNVNSLVATVRDRFS